MKYAFLLILSLFVASNMVAQSAGPPQQKNLVNATNLLPGAAIAAGEQSKNWEAEKDNHLYSGNAWLNYYLWTGRNKALTIAEKNKTLAIIFKESQNYISGQFEYYLMNFIHTGKKDSASIFKALAIATDKSKVYPYLIQYAIITGNNSAMATWCHALNGLRRLPPYLYQYHYNALMSADTNAVIYASGLHDLVPMAILQQVYNVRKDIRLTYYDGNLNTQQPVYLCLSLGKEVLAQYPNAVCTGLLVKAYGQKSFTELKNHIENKFDWGLLNSEPATWQQDVAQLYCNYLPAFIMLYRYYSAHDHNKARNMKSLIQKMAANAGKQEVINIMEEK